MNPAPKLICTLIVAGTLASLTGCTSMDAANKEPLLSAAGFVARTPETAKQKELFAAAPAYKVHRVTAANGKIFYAYKDEAKNLAYLGSEAQYQQYQKLATAQRIARDQYEAAEMNRDLAWGWYGAYGRYAPYGYGPGVRMMR